jgi:hypothetical protein
VAVADLHEAQLTRPYFASHLRHLAHAVGLQDSTLHDAESTSSSPRHTLQESTPVDTIVVVIMQQFIFGPRRHNSS